MLTAAEELQRYLDKLPDDEFVEFCDKIGYQQTITGIRPMIYDGRQASLKSRKHEHHASLSRLIGEDGDRLAELRPQVTTDICVSAYSDPELFARACNAAGIQTDDARTLDFQRVSANAAADASESARVSAHAAAASEKHASTANRIAKKSNRLSFASVIVSAIAALIAVGSLIVAILALGK